MDNLVAKNWTIAAGNKKKLIVGVNIGYEIREIVDASEYKDRVIYIPSMQYSHQDIFFLLSEDHLPALEHVDLSKEEIEELLLVPINKKLKIYASVIDLNKDEFTKNNWQSETSLDNADAKVQVAISFKSEIHWSEERQLIQINLSSEYKEQ